MISGRRIDIYVPRWYSALSLVFLVIFSVFVFVSLIEKSVSVPFIALTVLFFVLAFSVSIYQLVTGKAVGWLRFK